MKTSGAHRTVHSIVSNLIVWFGTHFVLHVGGRS